MIRRAAGRAAVLAAAGLLPAGLLLAAPAMAAGPTATFHKSSDWGTGYEAGFTVTNSGTTTLTNWTLAFDLGPNQRITSLWNGTFTPNGSRVTVSPASWNATLAPGATADIGFDASYTGSYADPANCSLNGAACDGSAGGGGGGGDTQRPTAPTLTSTGNTTNSVSLTWSGATDNVGVTGYDVRDGGTTVGSTAGTSFTVSGLAAASPHTFTVTARDAAGNVSPASNTVTVTTQADGGGTTPPPSGGFKRVAYFTQWSIYARAYNVKNIVTSGTAGKLDVINYAFANIDPVNLTCFEANHAAGGDSDPNAGDGAGDAWADYQKPFDSSTSVDGSSDVFNQPLKGNFNQLKQLKARFPNLKVLMSLGGWSYSKHFSDAAATATSRQRLVSSCIDMFIKGNLPSLQGDPTGGAGAAAGIFDGFDLDWEWPSSNAAHLGNIARPQDKQNYTLLMQEFRRQLDALGSQTGKHYALSAFLPADPVKINAGIEVPGVFQALDWATIQGYDLHGAFEPTTNHQSALFSPTGDPSPEKFSVDLAVKTYLAQSAPKSKMVIGVPFYGRGWTGVPNVNGGLFQQSGGCAQGTFECGFEDYKRLKNLSGFTLHRDNAVGAAYLYNGSTFWNFDDPTSIGQKMAYIKANGLGGAMAWSLDGDDATGSLATALSTGLS